VGIAATASNVMGPTKGQWRSLTNSKLGIEGTIISKTEFPTTTSAKCLAGLPYLGQ